MKLLGTRSDPEDRLSLVELTTHSGHEKPDINFDMLGVVSAGKSTLLSALVLYLLRQASPSDVIPSDKIREQVTRTICHRETRPTVLPGDSKPGSPTEEFSDPPEGTNPRAMQPRSEYLLVPMGGKTVQIDSLPGQVLQSVPSKSIVQLYQANPRRMGIAVLHALRTNSMGNYYATLDSMYLLQQGVTPQFGKSYSCAFEAINHWPVSKLSTLNVRGASELLKLTDCRLLPREGWTGRGDEPYDIAGVAADDGRAILKTLRTLSETISDIERFQLTPLRLAAQQLPGRFILYQSHYDLIRGLPSVRARPDFLDENAGWFYGGLSTLQSPRIYGDAINVTVSGHGDQVYVDRAAQLGPERVLAAIESHVSKFRLQSKWSRWMQQAKAALY